jgi:rod shape determining protein RodA
MVVTPFYQQQLVWGASGLMVILGLLLFDYRHFKSLAVPTYLAAVFLLLLVLVVGEVTYGARRWLSLGLFNVQPSEVAKIAILLMGAKLLSRGKAPLGWLKLLEVGALCVLPVGLIMLQPDLGTALNILLLLGGMLLFRGIKLKALAVLVIILPLCIPLGWQFMHEYQKDRVRTFIDPQRDRQGRGWNIIQSQIAIGSGQVWGKGYLQGTQDKLLFLPENHTDFALAVFGEEWGFAGCVALTSMFCLFLLSICATVRDAKDKFGSYIAVGAFFYFFWQILINMGMVLGIMPVVGIPLPFISYGGSATLVNSFIIGIVLNVSMRRFVFKTG